MDGILRWQKSCTQCFSCVFKPTCLQGLRGAFRKDNGQGKLPITPGLVHPSMPITPGSVVLMMMSFVFTAKYAEKSLALATVTIVGYARQQSQSEDRYI